MKHFVAFLLAVTFCPPVFSQTRGAAVVNAETTATISGDSTYALIAGVSSYEFIQPLNYADADAKEFYRYLTAKNGAGIPTDHIKLLLNKDVTRNSLLNNIYAFLAKNRDKAKRIIIYFSGHGDADLFGEHYLLASGCNPSGDVNNYAATDAISVNEIKNKLKLFLGAGTEVILVMDACRTGQVVKGSSPNLLDLTANLEQVNGELLFLSCEKGQVSQEGKQWGSGRGIFSYHLINGLWGKADKNADHVVSIDELKRYTDNAIYNDPNNKTAQVPVFRYNNNSAYPLFPALATEELAMGSNENIPSGVTYKNAVKIKSGLVADVNLTKFYSAIGSRKLLTPANDCGLFYIEQMKKAKVNTDVLKDAMNTLAIELLDSCMRIMNLYIDGLDNLGNYQYRIGKVFTNGASMFAKSSELLADISPDVMEANRHIGLFLKGRSILEIEEESARVAKLPEALQCTNDALKLKPNAAFLLHLKSLVLNAMGKKEEAIVAEQEAIRLAPNWIYPYNTLGGIYFSQRKYGDAVIQYEKALAIDSNSFLPYIGLGNAWKKQGKLNKALLYYNQSIQKDSLNAVGYYNRGFYYLHSNDAAKAKKDFEKSLQIDARFYDAYLGMAMYYELKGQYTDALKQYEAAAVIDKVALKEILASASSLEMLGRTEQATLYREQYKLLEAKYGKP